MRTFILLALASFYSGIGHGQTLTSTSLCVNYAFETESKFMDPRLALGKSGEDCRSQTDGECLEYTYKRLQKLSGKTPSQQELKEMWGEAVAACRFYVYAPCLAAAENFWRTVGRAAQPFQSAVTTCRNQIEGDCLLYAYQYEKKNSPDQVVAFNQAASTCKGGVEASCLKLVYEKLLPKVRGITRDPWEDAVGICRKARLYFD